jgi:hypothetical protein
MTATTKPATYTAEQVKEIVDRITTLRTHWLRAVETQLASRRVRPDLSTDTGSKSPIGAA